MAAGNAYTNFKASILHNVFAIVVCIDKKSKFLCFQYLNYKVIKKQSTCMYCLLNCSERSWTVKQAIHTTLEPTKHQHIQPSFKKDTNTPIQNLQHKYDLQDIFQVLYAAYLTTTAGHDSKIHEYFNSLLIAFTFYLIQFTW